MIKVFKIRDLIKYIIRILIPITVLLIVMQVVSNEKLARKVKESNEEKKALINNISETISQIELVNKKNENSEEANEETKKEDFIFLSELAVLENVKEKEETDGENVSDENKTEDSTNEVKQDEENKQENVTKAETNVKTTVIENSVNPRVTNDYNGIKINNISDHVLTDDILNPDIEVNKKKVVIYHTHTCESYTPSEKYNYQATGNYRSTDLNFSVARVGDELDKQLSSYGVTVIHDKTYHDHPAYNGSYSRSLVTAERILADNQDADIVIDLHRDAIADASYAPKVKIGEEYASQLMFVMGGLNDNWVQNLKFAVKVMKKANELYPGLFKPLILRNSEYNQHLAKAGCIIEVGATGNTLEESICSMKYLAKILNEI